MFLNKRGASIFTCTLTIQKMRRVGREGGGGVKSAKVSGHVTKEKIGLKSIYTLSNKRLMLNYFFHAEVPSLVIKLSSFTLLILCKKKKKKSWRVFTIFKNNFLPFI